MTKTKTAAELVAAQVEAAVEQVRFTSKQLTREAQGLGRRMTELGEGVEAGVAPNELGEVQGAGASVDVLCGKLRAQQEKLATLRKLHAAVTAAEGV